VEYVLDRIGTAPFKLLSSELVEALTQHSIEAVDSDPLRCSSSAEPVNLRWPDFLGGEVWGGLILIDCLYVSESDQRVCTADWFASHMKKRLEHEALIREKEVARRRRLPGLEAHDEAEDAILENVPQYIIFSTNLPLQTVNAANDPAIQGKLAALGLRGWKIWDRATVGKMLDAADSVRRKYLARLAPQNIMDHLHEYNVGISSRLLGLFKVQMINELKANQWVRLSQAGDADSARLPLDQVGIDLPVKDQVRKAARLIIEEADAASTFRGSGKTANVLLVGGPGQGKSTITQLIGQCYRVALLDGSLHQDHLTHPLAEALALGFQEGGVPLPQFRRWPVRIDLASYVDAAVDYRETSLIAYIAEQAGRRAGGISGPKVKTWLKAWPWLMILDGFDEVASSRGRETLMDQLDNFMGEVEGLGADVFIVATTRPQGYAGEFAHHGYREFELAPLDVQRAVEYGLKLAEARHGDKDPDMRDRVIERLNRAASDILTARLMRSPLQVSIMSTLLEARERVPRARFELFDAYYQAIYSRESEKPGPIGKLLEKRRSHINALHNWLGLVLQANSEKAGDLDASVPHEELRRYAIERLEKQGHDAKQASALGEEIIKAVTSRLVLIVPKKVEDVGFEVRSIQEFFAARALVSGPDSCVLDRLNSIIAPAHWRNTWLFAAGKAFLDREHIRRNIVSLLIEIDNTDLMRMVVAPGADLALDLLEDDIASDEPVLQHTLFRHAFELTKYPPDQDLRRRASVLFQLAENDTYLAGVMERSIDEAIAGTPGQLDAAHAVLESADRGATRLAFKFRPRLRDIEQIRARTALAEDHSHVLEQTLTATLRETDLSESDYRLAEHFISAFTSGSIRSDAVMGDPREQALSRELLDKCLTRDRVADVLAKATIAAAQEDSRSGSELRSLMRSWLQRRAAGPKLLELTYG
jgi:hypothetical protein